MGIESIRRQYNYDWLKDCKGMSLYEIVQTHAEAKDLSVFKGVVFDFVQVFRGHFTKEMLTDQKSRVKVSVRYLGMFVTVDMARLFLINPWTGNRWDDDPIKTNLSKSGDLLVYKIEHGLKSADHPKTRVLADSREMFLVGDIMDVSVMYTEAMMVLGS